MSDVQTAHLQVVQRKVAALVPYAQNARTHSPEQVDRIAGSMKEFGWTSPVLINGEGGVIAGHGRIMAAEQLGLDEVPCIVLDHLTEQQQRALVLADNQLAISGAGWNEDLLAAELTILKDAEYDLSLTGFDESDLARLFATKGEVDPDDAPQPPDVPTSRLGDVWILGDHRLVCGSSTDPDDVAAALDGQRPHLMVTDPPYGVKYDADWRNHTNDLGRSARAVGKVQNDDRADWSAAYALFPGDVAYVWHAGTRVAEVELSLTSEGFEIRAQIIWAKNNIVIGRGDYHPKHEPLFYAVRKGKKGHWQGSRKESTVWDIPKPMKSETGHSTQKPLECMRRPIENNSKAGDRVYEPFAGSFTTGIACEMTGRRCHAIELDCGYVDVGVLRWQTFTGQEATLESSGQTFAQVKEERASETHDHREPVLGADAR